MSQRVKFEETSALPGGSVADPKSIDRRNVYIVILNWNGWRDTVECLESVFRLNHRRFTAVVCDNDSSDGSLEHIKDWAEGRVLASCANASLSGLVTPPVPKPVPFDPATSVSPAAVSPRLALIQTGSNLGFAGGCNVGSRYALAHGDCDYVWLLNNDTVVDPDALSAMLRMVDANPALGVCGSLLRDYASPHEILTAGGRRYIRWSGRTRPLTDIATQRISTSPGAPDYIEGASMLFSRRCLEQTGLLDESYFLYFEEIDYVTRAQPAFAFGFAADSVVYHKEGASIGSSILRANRSSLSDFYMARSRLLFTWRHCPWFWPSVLAAVAVSFVQRILVGKPRNAVAIFRGALASFSRKLS